MSKQQRVRKRWELRSFSEGTPIHISKAELSVWETLRGKSVSVRAALAEEIHFESYIARYNQGCRCELLMVNPKWFQRLGITGCSSFVICEQMLAQEAGTRSVRSKLKPGETR